MAIKNNIILEGKGSLNSAIIWVKKWPFQTKFEYFCLHIKYIIKNVFFNCPLNSQKLWAKMIFSEIYSFIILKEEHILPREARYVF